MSTAPQPQPQPHQLQKISWDVSQGPPHIIANKQTQSLSEQQKVACSLARAAPAVPDVVWDEVGIGKTEFQDVLMNPDVKSVCIYV